MEKIRQLLSFIKETYHFRRCFDCFQDDELDLTNRISVISIEISRLF